jgi:hypothetical protein
MKKWAKKKGAKRKGRLENRPAGHALKAIA